MIIIITSDCSKNGWNGGIIIIIIIIIISDCSKNGWNGGSPTVVNDADGDSSLAMNNRLWIRRGVSRGIKRNQIKNKKMEGWKNEGACGNECSR